MVKSRIQSDHAPKAVGPYSQAIKSKGLIFCSGQVAINPESGKVMQDASVVEQTHQIMKNLKAVLEAAGADFSHVVKTTIFTTDLTHYGKINEIYGSYFEGFDPPARSTIQVAALPLDMMVEIEMIAMTD